MILYITNIRFLRFIAVSCDITTICMKGNIMPYIFFLVSPHYLYLLIPNFGNLYENQISFEPLLMCVYVIVIP